MLWSSSLVLLWKRTGMCHGTWYVKVECWPKDLTGLAAFTGTDTVCENWQVQLYHSISQLEQKAGTASSGKPICVETSDHWSSCHKFGNSAIGSFCTSPFVESDLVYCLVNLHWCRGKLHESNHVQCFENVTMSTLGDWNIQWLQTGIIMLHSSSSTPQFRSSAAHKCPGWFGGFVTCISPLFVKSRGWFLDSK